MVRTCFVHSPETTASLYAFLTGRQRLEDVSRWIVNDITKKYEHQPSDWLKIGYARPCPPKEGCRQQAICLCRSQLLSCIRNNSCCAQLFGLLFQSRSLTIPRSLFYFSSGCCVAPIKARALWCKVYGCTN